MKSLIVWQLIYQSLRQHIPVMLLYVVESSGSSPGRQGFLMAVNAHGEMEGSIGGGIMEHKFVEMARERLKTGTLHGYDRGLRKQVHAKSAAKNQSGMICSGEQSIVLYEVVESDLPAIEQLIISLEEHKNGTLILSPAGIVFDSKPPGHDYSFSKHSEDDWIYKEKTGYKQQLFIIGGGHCSLALSRLMRPLDFYIRVYDDREGLKTMQENESAHEKYFVNSYTELATQIVSGENNYAVIMTFGYRTDDIAVRALMEKRFRFLGLLGSKTKIAQLFDEYRKEGINEEILIRIHSPVGIQIKSQTPEEIAISIAAEIIQEKNK